MSDDGSKTVDAAIADLLAPLTAEERQVIVMRFFETGGPRTIEEAAIALGIDAEACKILEETAFEKLPSLKA